MGGYQAAQNFHHTTAEGVDSGTPVFVFQVAMYYGALAAG
jgi:hypothetical protein